VPPLGLWPRVVRIHRPGASESFDGALARCDPLERGAALAILIGGEQDEAALSSTNEHLRDAPLPRKIRLANAGGTPLELGGRQPSHPLHARMIGELFR
jgi:hypothetical protein